MTKKQKILLVVGIVLLLTCIGIILAMVLPKAPMEEQAAPAAGDMTYTVQVENASGMTFSGVGVYIYEDETLSELIWFDKTNDQGQMQFTETASDSYVAVLADVPAGYQKEDIYPITGELTKIVLSAGVVDEDAAEDLKLGLGDVMMDFTVTTPDGTEYVLSELLKEKRAVILNFWYIECQPCNLEFPFMQEAYEKYSDYLEILAMNPVNMSDEEIAAFQQQMGLTFPMAKVDAVWEQIMQLTAYPTTVVIDRYGNIVLIHKGMIDNAETFEQLFAYFTADDYEPKAIEKLEDIVVPEEGSSEENPMMAGNSDLEFTVGPGKEYFLELYKIVQKMYLTFASDGDFHVIYNGNTYYSQNGKLTLTVEADNLRSAVKITVVNDSDKELTIYGYFSAPGGTLGNPYTLKMGEFTASVSAGNDQGVFYNYTAPEDGYLMLQLKGVSPKNVQCGFALYNLSSYKYMTAEADGSNSDDGYRTLIMPVKKGQKIQFSAAAVPDSEWNYPAATFTFIATFMDEEEAKKKEEEGELEDLPDLEEEEEIELPSVTYKVTVVDQDGEPVPDVIINLQGTLEYVYEPEEDASDDKNEDKSDDKKEKKTFTEKVNVNLTTNEKGVVKQKGLPGTLTGTIFVPDGYTVASSRFELTEEAPKLKIKLTKIEEVAMKNYTVTIVDPEGNPVPGVTVMIGTGFAETDEKGKVTLKLAEQEGYTAYIANVPAQYTLEKTAFTFKEGKNKLKITVDWSVGTEKNPIPVEDKLFFFADDIPAEGEVYYAVSGVQGSTLTIGDGTTPVNVYVKVNGGEPVYPDETTGILTIPMDVEEEPVLIGIGNPGEEDTSYRVNFVFPLGTRQNPEPLTSLAMIRTTLEAGDENGYYYSYTCVNNAELTVSYRAPWPAADNTITVTGATVEQAITYSVDGRTAKAVVDVLANEPVLIHVAAVDTTQGATVTIKGSLAEEPLEPGQTRYNVTLQDREENRLEGLNVQFMQGETAVTEVLTTNARGTVSAVLPTGEYTAVLLSDRYSYDEDLLDLSETNKNVVVTLTELPPPVEEGKTRYMVTVTDYVDAPQKNVMVKFMNGSAMAGFGTTDKNGEVTLDLDTAKYTIELAFSDSKTYYYTSGVTVKEGAPKATVKVTSQLPGDEKKTFWGSNNAEQSEYNVGEYTCKPVTAGGTYLSQMQSDIMNFYYFTPEEAGTYLFTTSSSKAKLHYFGGSTYPFHWTQADMEEEGYICGKNKFSMSIHEKKLGVTYVLGVTGAEDCVLIIKRTGDAAFDEAYADAVPYELQEEPKPFTLKLGKKETLTYIDLEGKTKANKPVYNKKDGYYHLGSEDGPIIYVNMGLSDSNMRYIPLYIMCGGNGMTASGFSYSYYDDDGNFIKKEQYNEAIIAIGECADETYGVYPLNDDLILMLQNGGSRMGWWDKDHPNFLFEELDKLNTDIAWMFCCCYVTEASTASLSLTPDVADQAPAAEEVEVEAPVEEVVEATEPTEQEATESTEPEVTESTEPEVTEPTELEATEPTEPKATEPTEPEGTEPTEPEATESTEPEGTEPTEPEGTEPTEQEATEPTEGE